MIGSGTRREEEEEEEEGSAGPLMRRITGRESREEKWREFCVDLVPLPKQSDAGIGGGARDYG